MPQAFRPPPDLLALLAGVSRSFYVSIRLLPGPLRHPIALAYLLARATDTVADTTEIGVQERGAMLQTLAAAIDGVPTDPSVIYGLAAAFAPRQRDDAERQLVLGLPWCLDGLARLTPVDQEDIRTVLRHITRGQTLDIERFGQAGAPRAPESPAQLDEYTYLVAGCVGEFWTDLCFRHLEGFATLPQPRMRELGRGYGMGLQLINILRDAGEDLAAGRCYFPADQLAAAGLAPGELSVAPERLLPLLRPWHALAQQRLAMGMQYADAVNSRRVRAASALPALLGTRTLAMLQAAGPQALRQKVKMPRREVRGVLAGLAFTLAGRVSLQSQFLRLRGPLAAGWDNPAP